MLCIDVLFCPRLDVTYNENFKYRLVSLSGVMLSVSECVEFNVALNT